LTKIEGDGSFSCPYCGTIISPDDETEDVYTIVETKMKHDSLDELVIKCNKCEHRMRLVGFQTELSH
jgi:DNA-directed RNA polymerase subunit RPC12/RpoP